MTATQQSFGRYADQVEDFGGEYILPIGQYEIHPTTGGGFAVVAPSGEVLVRYASIEDAVNDASRR